MDAHEKDEATGISWHQRLMDRISGTFHALKNRSGTPEGRRKIRNLMIATSTGVTLALWWAGVSHYVHKSNLEKEKAHAEKTKKLAEEREARKYDREIRAKHQEILHSGKVATEPLGPFGAISTEDLPPKENRPTETTDISPVPTYKPVTSEESIKKKEVFVDGSPESMAQLSDILKAYSGSPSTKKK